MFTDDIKTLQDAPGRDKSQIEGQDRGKTLFDDFKPADWASYSKMLDAHERAAWLEGYKTAKNEVLQEIVRNYGKKGNP